MVGLNGTLQLASEALSAQYAGLEIANNNIANANTPGYSRQVVSLSPAASVQNGVSVDAGVSYEGYSSVRDAVLQLAIDAKTSEQSSWTTQSSILGQVDTAFSDNTRGIGTAISSLFSDLSSLSTTPSDPSARQTVIKDANQLADAFHRGASALASASKSADQQVASTTARINQLTQQIAGLNSQLETLNSNTQGGGALEDQRDALTTQLAQLIGLSVTRTDGSPTLTTAGGTSLVIGTTSYSLQVTSAPDGTAHVLDASGGDITNSLSGGSLGGSITARDNTLAALSQQLDALASQFATAMNSAQSSGYDANGAQGGALFTVPSTVIGAASQMAVTLASGSGLAISSDSSANGTGNLQAFLTIQANPLPGGANPTNSYAAFVQNVGRAAAQVHADLKGTTSVLQQLTRQQSSSSGVSLDEETTNLIRFQQAYTAAAKVVSTINSLYNVLMNMTGA